MSLERSGASGVTGKGAEQPLVSVLVPLYNHERYVEQCLESIVGDGYPNLEIVMLDDGSKDSSLEMARAWGEANAHRLGGRFELLSRENRGVTRTLNELIEKAGGEFIVLLASDDYLLPGGIAARLDYLRSHPGRMAVIGDCIVIDEHNRKTSDSGITRYHRGRKSYLAHDRLIAYELVFRWCVPGPVFMARKELYDIVGGYNEEIAVEDRDFFLRLAARNLLGFVDFPVAAYRVHSGGFTSTPARELCYKEAMQVTMAANAPAFSGLCRIYLLGEELALDGEVARLRGKGGAGIFCRKTGGKLLISLAKRLYGLVGPLMLRSHGGEA